MSTSDNKLGKPTPIRLSEDLDKKLDFAAKRLGMSKQEVLRLACAVGLEDIRRANYDLAGALVDRAHQDRNTLSDAGGEQTLMVAERPDVKYGSSKRRSA